MAFPVLLDICVLFPMYLRDTLLRLAVAEVYQPLWSADILGEPQTVLVREADQDGGYRREPTTIDGLMVALARSGAPGFADEIRRRLA